jgi:hypothetical protein
MTVGDWFNAVRSGWRILLQGSTWVMVLLAGFVLEPPIWDFEQNLIWYRFAHFLVAALIGLMFVPASRFSSKKHVTNWLVISVILIILGGASFFEYQVLREDWTVEYSKRPVIIGRTYTADAVEYKRKVREEEGRNVSDRELVMDAAGDRGELWDISEIRQRGRILAAVYLVSVALFALTMISVIQVIYCQFNTGRCGRRKQGETSHGS